MDNDFYYKYSELWLVKHATSLLDSWNTENNWGEPDWPVSEITEWSRSEVQRRLRKCCWQRIQGAASVVEESMLTEQLSRPAVSELTSPSPCLLYTSDAADDPRVV